MGSSKDAQVTSYQLMLSSNLLYIVCCACMPNYAVIKDMACTAAMCASPTVHCVQAAHFIFTHSMQHCISFAPV